MTEERKKANRLEWYVMRCRRTDAIVDKIDDYFNSNPALTEKLESYFISFVKFDAKSVTQPLVGKEPSAEDKARADAARRSKGFRSALRQYVFLKIRPSGLEALAHQKWNIEGTRLYHYRDFNGEEVTVPPHMMTRFMDACAEYGDKLEICTQQQTIEKGLMVKVREGAFAGLDAEVVSIDYKASGMRFTIAVKLFGQGNYAYVHNRTPDDVVISDKDSYAFTEDFIDRLEDNILSILKWHIKKAEKTHDDLIEGYFRMRNVSMKGIHLAVRFDTLMLYCAVLLKKTSAKTRYTKLLKNRLKELPSSDIADKTKVRSQAYILSGLYLSTKDAEYRDRLKRIVREQLPPEDILRRHVAILREL